MCVFVCAHAHTAEGDYVIDAGKAGNASRFVNHSCDPLLRAVTVFVNTRDERQRERERDRKRETQRERDRERDIERERRTERRERERTQSIAKNTC